MQRQEYSTQDRVCPQDQGLPEQEVDSEEGVACSEHQAGSQWPLGLGKVAFGACRARVSVRPSALVLPVPWPTILPRPVPL